MILATLPTFAQERDFNQTLNKRPLQDFADSVIQQLDKKTLDLNKTFSVTLEGYLTKEGKLDANRSKFTKSEGDMQMVEIGKYAIEAVSDSNLFSYLQALGIEKVIVNFSQDDKNVLVKLISDVKTAEKAKTIASGFNMLIRLAKINEKEDKEVTTLLNATNIETQDKNCIINFTIPKSEAHKFLKQRLSEQMSFEPWLKRKVENNEVDLTQPFLVEMQGWMNEQGKIEKKSLQILKTEGDVEMVEIGQKSIEEIAGNGLLKLLKDMGLIDVSFKLQGDAKEISLVMRSYAKTTENAKNLAEVFNQMTQSGANNSSESLRTKWAIKYLKASADNNYLTLGFWFPRQEMIQMIKERLKEIGNE